MNSDNDLAFSREEYAARISRVREEMSQRGLDMLAVFWPENINYLTGFDSLGYFSYQCLLVPAQGEPTHIVRRMERDNVLVRSVVKNCVTYGEGKDPVEATLDVIREYSTGAPKVGVELDGWFLTSGRYMELREHHDLIDASQIVNQVRLIKSPAEVEKMREAVRAAEAGFNSALGTIKPGNSENDVAAEFMRAAIAAGSEYTGHAPLISSGPRSEQTFATWKRRTLQSGDVMFFEPGAAINRYHGMFIRTISIGEPRDDLKRFSDVSIEGLNLLLEKIRPGITGHEIDEITRSVPEKHGMGEYRIGRSGYSLGIGYPPDWGEGRTYSVGPGEQKPLQEGMVLHVMNPMHREGDLKVGFSETIVLTKDGSEVLTSVPRELFVL